MKYFIIAVLVILPYSAATAQELGPTPNPQPPKTGKPSKTEMQVDCKHRGGDRRDCSMMM
ncbi:MAG: hypothetical protein V7L23_29885 [Nostoc sp.]|uniref:hypothetical protein n=1 Tax=Nostoc sp. TaxID=1180 RepID=UPI002FF2C425